MFIRGLVRLLFRLWGGLTVVGLKNVPLKGPVLIAPVHVSHLDPPLVGSVTRRWLRLMAKEELFKVPVLGPLIRSLGAYPVRRGQSDAATIRQTLDWLNQGWAVLVFPEGTRGDGVTMGRIQSGLAMLAKRTGAAVVPVGIGGTVGMMPRGRSWPKRSRVKIVYGKPFTYQDVVDSAGKESTRDAFVTVLQSRLLDVSREAGLELEPPTQRETQVGAASLEDGLQVDSGNGA